MAETPWTTDFTTAVGARFVELYERLQHEDLTAEQQALAQHWREVPPDYVTNSAMAYDDAVVLALAAAVVEVDAARDHDHPFAA